MAQPPASMNSVLPGYPGTLDRATEVCNQVVFTSVLVDSQNDTYAVSDGGVSQPGITGVACFCFEA